MGGGSSLKANELMLARKTRTEKSGSHWFLEGERFGRLRRSIINANSQGVWFDNPSGSGQAWLFTQAKGPYKLEQAMALEHWLSQINSSFTTGINVLTVSQFNKVVWFWRLLIALGISRVFF